MKLVEALKQLSDDVYLTRGLGDKLYKDGNTIRQKQKKSRSKIWKPCVEELFMEDWEVVHEPVKLPKTFVLWIRLPACKRLHLQEQVVHGWFKNSARGFVGQDVLFIAPKEGLDEYLASPEVTNAFADAIDIKAAHPRVSLIAHKNINIVTPYPYWIKGGNRAILANGRIGNMRPDSVQGVVVEFGIEFLY